MLNIEQNKIDDVLVVRVEGQVNTETSDDLREAVFGTIDKGARRVVIDCSGLTYISSAGLRALMLIGSKLKPLGGTIGLSSLQNEIQKHMEDTGFLGLFTVYKNIDEAVAN